VRLFPRAAPRAQERPPAGEPPWDPGAREAEPDMLTSQEATERLRRRLDDADVEEVVARLDGEQAQTWEEADEADRSWLALALGVHNRVPAVLAKTGLVAAEPPEDVHAMGRGPPAAGGAYYYADLVVDALREGGAEPRAGMRGLDFGCSSGRIVRVLAAAYPELEWHGCDPLESAIAWAREHLPGAEFAVSPQEPPLPYADAAFDFAFAISIWSHYGEGAATRWLREMRRVVRPGGLLVLTTHGYHSIAHYARNGLRTREQLAEIGAELYARGFWFAPEFGEAGDWGIKSPQWGTAFLTPEWLLRTACPAWDVAAFHPGRAEGNQDVYVLERT